MRHRTQGVHVRYRTDSPAPLAYRGGSNETNERLNAMLYTIAVILIILWLLGLVTSYTMGGFIHILLVIAIVVVLVNFISGRKTL